jgi:hypothetical protein
MPTTKLTPDEVVDQGEAIYRERLQAHLEPGNIGKFLVIDINTGEYEMGDDHSATLKGALAKRPDAVLCGLKIGYPATARLSGRLRRNTP